MATRHDDRRVSLSPDGMPDHLTARLRRLPDVDPPEGLSSRIMDALHTRRRPWLPMVIYKFQRLRIRAVTPLKWAPAAVALAIGVIIGISFNQNPDESGLQAVRPAVDTDADYRQGRKLLAEGQAEKALVHLTRAADVQPGEALYQFWLGVTYWALEDPDRERLHYQNALAHDPDFLPAHVYIGHNYLDRGEYEAAQRHYRHVLQVVPDHAEALFYTGKVLHRLGDTRAENEAWQTYLEHYDRGRPALQAVEILNTNGDFSYRRIQLGPLSIVKPSIVFAEGHPGLDAVSRTTLDDIGRIVAGNHKLTLHVLAYAANDIDVARKRAKTIKNYLLDRHSGLSARRIKPSWFGVSEKIKREDRSYELESSIRLFATHVDES